MISKTFNLKHLVLYLLSLVIFVIIYIVISSTVKADTPIETIDLQTAQVITNNWLSQNNLPKNKHLERFTDKKVKKTHSFNDASGNVLAFVVDLEPEGFVIIPQSEAVDPILYFSLTGAFDGKYDEKNPLSFILTRDIPDRIDRYQKLDINTKNKIKNKWKLLKSQTVQAESTVGDNVYSAVTPIAGPLMTTKWDQGYPYNYYVPNNYWAGCVAVAYAQVIRFYRYPASAWDHSILLVDSDPAQFAYFGSNYNYYNMPDTLGGANQAQIEETAKLIYDVGISMPTSYAPTGSGAFGGNTAVLKYVFNFKTADKKEGSDPNWPSDFQNELKNGYPLILGIGNSEGTAASHEVVADGLASDGVFNYYHINMGWGGLDDGWYNLPDFVAGYHWNVLLDYVYNIRVKPSPIYDSIPPPPSNTKLTLYKKVYNIYENSHLISYVISWVNNTSNAISTDNVVIEDLIPSGTTYKSANGWDSDIVRYDPNTSKVTWQIKSPFMQSPTGQLPPGSFGRVWLSVNF